MVTRGKGTIIITIVVASTINISIVLFTEKKSDPEERTIVIPIVMVDIIVIMSFVIYGKSNSDLGGPLSIIQIKEKQKTITITMIIAIVSPGGADKNKQMP